MPSFSMSGTPPAKTAMSVVVPPMSSTTQSCVMSQRAAIPMTLAAGPESIVSTGTPRESENGMVPPSALSTFTSASIPSSVRQASIASANPL